MAAQAASSSAGGGGNRGIEQGGGITAAGECDRDTQAAGRGVAEARQAVEPEGGVNRPPDVIRLACPACGSFIGTLQGGYFEARPCKCGCEVQVSMAKEKVERLLTSRRSAILTA